MIVGNPKESGADLAVALVNTWDTYDDPHEHLVGAWWVKVDGVDLPGAGHLSQQRRACLHRRLLLVPPRT